MDLQGGELFLPEVPQACESMVRAGFVILLPGLFCGVLPAGAQIKEDAFFLAGAEDQLFLQRSADVAAKLRAAGENTLFDGGRVAFGPVGAYEGFPDAVMPVRSRYLTGEAVSLAPGSDLRAAICSGAVAIRNLRKIPCVVSDM